jgi:hypothetical protein
MPFPAALTVEALDRTRAGHDPRDLSKLRTLYGPSGAWRQHVDEWLPRHPWENDEKRQIRLQLATYRSDAAGIIDRVKAMLFSEQPQITGGREATVQRLGDNADGAGAPLHAYFADRLVDALTCRRSWVWVELPADPADFDRRMATQADVEARGLNSAYLRTIDPRAVYDWREDATGLVWVKFREEDTRDADEPWEEPRKVVRWTWIDRAEVAVYEWVQQPKGPSVPQEKDVVSAVSRVAHGRASHPVRCMALPEGLWLLDRMRESIVAALRSRNNLDFTLTVASGALLAVTARAHDPGSPPLTGTGVYVGLTRDSDGEDNIKFVEPSGQNTALIAKRANEAVAEVYEVAQQAANNTGATGSGGKYQSGNAKVEERAVLEAMLADYATRVKTFIADVLRAVADAEGWTAAERESVNIDGLYGWHNLVLPEFLSAATLSVELKALSPEAVRSIARSQAQRIMPPGRALETVLSEIAEADDDLVRQLGGVGPDGQSLAAMSGALGGANGRARVPGDADGDGIPNE